MPEQPLATQSTRIYTRQQSGRIGGLIRAATAPTPQSITEAARQGTWQKFLDEAAELCPEVKDNPGELERRAQLLEKAHMTRLSAKASAARRLKAKLRQLEADLEAEQAAAADHVA